MKAYTIGAKRRSKRMAFDLPTTPPRKKKGRAYVLRRVFRGWGG